MSEKVREVWERIQAGEVDEVTTLFNNLDLPKYEDLTEEQYLKAKNVMSTLLKKYDGKDKIPPEVMKHYNNALAVVHVWSENKAKENMSNMNAAKDRRNKIADFLMQYSEMIGYSGIRGEFINALYDLAEKGLLIGTENLSVLAKDHTEELYQVLQFIYDESFKLKDPNYKPRIIMVLPKKTCGGNYFVACGKL